MLVESDGRVVRARQDTILIAHNIDLASRVPLKEGDEIRFKGEVEWAIAAG